MPDDPIRAYLDAAKVFDQRKAEANEVIGLVLKAAQVLRDWPVADVSNLKGEIPHGGFPSSIRRVTAIDAKTWPTAERIAAVIIEAHHAENEAMNAWRQIPATDRQSLKEPERLIRQ